MSYLIGVAGLLLLVFIHELGHFVVAKAVGARATKFYVGFPPAVVKFRRGDTEYGLGAIPLGGYVRIPGMSRPQPSDLYRVVDAADEARLRRPDDDDDNLTAAVQAVSVALGRGPAEARGVIGAARAALERDRDLLVDRTFRQAAKDLDRITDDVDVTAYWTLAPWKQIAISVAGPAANVVAAIVILAALFVAGTPVARDTGLVAGVTVGSPAAAAGIRAGDHVVAIGTHAVADSVGIGRWIQASHGTPVVVTVKRAGARLTLPAVAAGYQPAGRRYVVGISLRMEQVGTVQESPFAATGHALQESWRYVRESGVAITQVFTPHGRENLQGPIGIVASSAGAVDQGYYVAELAAISLALALANMLPVLPLDGGHVFWTLVGVVRGGRPVPRSILERVALVGIAVFALLAIIMANQDIGRLMAP